MDNCAVIRFVARRPDGSNRAHPQMRVPLEDLTHIPRGWRVRREFIRTKPSQCGNHIWFPTSGQVQKSHRHLEVWPKFYSSISPPILKVSLRRSGPLAFLGCKMGAMKLELMFLLVIQCLEDTETFTLRYRTRLTERRKGSICCHFMRWSTQPGTRIRTVGSIWVKKAGLSALR